MANQPVPVMAVYGLSRLNTGSRQRRLAQTSPAWLHSAPPDSPPRCPSDDETYLRDSLDQTPGRQSGPPTPQPETPSPTCRTGGYTAAAPDRCPIGPGP